MFRYAEFLATYITQTAKAARERFRTSPRLKFAVWLACVLTTGFVAMAITASQDKTTAFLSGCAVALTSWGLLRLWRTLAPKLGKLTAAAAICAVSALVMFVFSQAIPNCPGESTVGKCTLTQSRSWAAVGFLLPVPPVLVSTLGLVSYKSSRWLLKKRFGRKVGTQRAKRR